MLPHAQSINSLLLKLVQALSKQPEETGCLNSKITPCKAQKKEFFQEHHLCLKSNPKHYALPIFHDHTHSKQLSFRAVVITQWSLRKNFLENTSDSNKIMTQQLFLEFPHSLPQKSRVKLQKELNLSLFSLNSNTIIKIKADLTPGTTTTWWNKYIYYKNIHIKKIHLHTHIYKI